MDILFHWILINIPRLNRSLENVRSWQVQIHLVLTDFWPIKVVEWIELLTEYFFLSRLFCEIDCRLIQFIIDNVLIFLNVIYRLLERVWVKPMLVVKELVGIKLTSMFVIPTGKEKKLIHTNLLTFQFLRLKLIVEYLVRHIIIIIVHIKWFVAAGDIADCFIIDFLHSHRSIWHFRFLDLIVGLVLWLTAILSSKGCLHIRSNMILTFNRSPSCLLKGFTGHLIGLAG